MDIATKKMPLGRPGMCGRATLTIVRDWWIHACMVILFAVFCSTATLAQETSATILGNVTDPTGAAVSKADVTVTNTETNVSTALQTNDSGAFNAPQLLPGTYSVTIKM